MGKKGEIQRNRVIESASYCLCTFGERGATFQAIAEHCQISQASVVKYLKTRENIFPTVLEYWLKRAREVTEAEIEKPRSSEEKLRQYLRTSISLFSERPDMYKIYMMLHYFASINERYKVINSEIKKTAQNRISEIIRGGIQDGSFAVSDVALTAKMVHNTLVGYLISNITEVKEPISLKLPTLLEDLTLDWVLKK